MRDLWGPPVHPLTRQMLATEPALVVHFWAPWNGNDVAFAPLFGAIAGEYRDSFTFASCDVDHPLGMALATRAKVINIPAVSFFQRGQHVQTRIGGLGEAVLRELMGDWRQALAG